MMTTITPADMKALETRFMEENNIPGALLMEHAALGVVDAIARYSDKGDVVFLCGPGNNGGDGYAAARLWAARGGMSHVFEMTADVHGDALLNRNLAKMTRGVIFHDEDDAFPDAEVFVDALFGIGLSRALDGTAARLLHRAKDSLEFTDIPVIAVDIPSGIDGLTGKVLGQALPATETVTFHRVKQGLVLADAPDYVGKITVQPILIPPHDELNDDYDGMDILTPDVLDDSPFRPGVTHPKWDYKRVAMFRRSATCHKGDFGRVVLFCGSRGMAGAAALCANSAMRSGAGLTTILCRESLLPILQALAPGAMCAVLPERDGTLLPESVEIARYSLKRADAACIGCGLGQSSDVMPILRLFANADCPVVWDADALNLLAKHEDLLPLKEADVITPHPGEAARLLDCDVDEVTKDMLAALDRLHELCGCTVLLKGARSLISDGIDTYCNLYTSPALAKGGSGDVLTGIITALLARYPDKDGQKQYVDGVDAVAYGALIHGMAGIRAAKIRSENCTLPTDVVDCIRLDTQGLD